MPVLRALIRTLVGSHDGHPACKICASQGSLLEQVEKGEQVIQIHLKNGYYYGPQFSAGRGISSRAAEFGRCRGIAVFPRNFTEFCANTEIPRQRPYSVSQYCCDIVTRSPFGQLHMLISVTRCHVQFTYLLKFLLTGPLYTKTTGES